jgi:hypothetical protein
MSLQHPASLDINQPERGGVSTKGGKERRQIRFSPYPTNAVPATAGEEAAAVAAPTSIVVGATTARANAVINSSLSPSLLNACTAEPPLKWAQTMTEAISASNRSSVMTKGEKFRSSITEICCTIVKL